MKYIQILSFFLFAMLTFTCTEMKDHQPKNQVIIDSTSYAIHDAVEPPPPDLISNFKNLSEWLSGICDGEKPKKLITNYDIGLFESEGSNIIYIVGVCSYKKGDTSYVKNEFESSNMYYKLPIEEYKNLSKEELLKKLSSQLKYFAASKKFNSSFLSKANNIVFTPDRKVIWHK